VDSLFDTGPVLKVAKGGTGAATAGAARTALSAAASGANSDITSLSGLTTVLSQAQGGTGTTTGYYGLKNRIINGAMVIDQRNAGASVAFTSAAYTLDRWVGAVGTATGTTIQRSTTSTTGFSNSALITIGTGASPVAGAVNRIYQVVEGFNIADFAWGTASAATVTLSFWVRSSVTGTFSGALYGASTIQSYPFNYTISAANTFEQKTITIAGPTTGTWDSTNGTGVYVNFDLGSGTTFKGTANAWAVGTFIGVTGATNLCATTGATFYITGVQLEKGSTATSFDYRPYGTELQLAQRYFESGGFVSFTTGGVNGIYQPIQFKVTKRVAAASCTSTNARSLTLIIFNDGTGVATGMYQGSNDSGASVSTWTISAEL
jgi:hypothetical protein